MSLHKVEQFQLLSKGEMDEGLRLHHLEAEAPSQLSDAFRAGAQWAANFAVGREQKRLEEVATPLYARTGDIKDINVLIIGRAALRGQV